MRGIILLIIVMVVCGAALIKPRIGLYGYIWFSLMRPDVAAFAAGRYNLATVLALVTLAASFRYFINFRKLLKPIPVMLILFEFVIAISANNALLPIYTWTEFERYLRMMIMCLLIPLVITEEKHFCEMFLVTTFSVGFLGLWWGFTAGIRGMRIWYGPGGFMGDNNGFAIALVMIVPFCWQARALVKKPWVKTALMAMLVGSVIAIILTYSRAGAVGLAITLVLLMLRSQRRAGAAVLIFIAVIPVLAMVGVSYRHRLSTIKTYDQDASAMSRLVQNQIAYKIWKQHPFLGVGIGDENYFLASRPYLNANDQTLIVHNSFMQVLVHTGIFGLLLYVAMMATALRICWRRGWREWKKDRENAIMPIAIFISLTGYALASLTHPRAWFDFYYMQLMFSSIWSGIMLRRQTGAVASSRIVMAKSTIRWSLAQPAPAAPAHRA